MVGGVDIVAGAVAGAGGEADGPGAGAVGGRGDGAVALFGSGLGAEKYTFFGGSESGTRIGVTHGTSGLCHVTFRE